MNTLEQRIKQLEVAMMFKSYLAKQITFTEWNEYSSKHEAIYKFTFKELSFTVYGLLEDAFIAACNYFNAKNKYFVEDDMSYTILY